jgi:hypothetical protein
VFRQLRLHRAPDSIRNSSHEQRYRQLPSADVGERGCRDQEEPRLDDEPNRRGKLDASLRG